jgi:hypothetical protein
MEQLPLNHTEAQHGANRGECTGRVQPAPWMMSCHSKQQNGLAIQHMQAACRQSSSHILFLVRVV